MLNSEERRKYILDTLENAEKPCSATVFAEECNVSRQIIVGDIALIRASGVEILSTNRGYILKKEEDIFRNFVKVSHDFSRLREELYIIVDGGARVLDVAVDHKVYGMIRADLGLSSRREVDQFIDKFENSNDMFLCSVTNNDHYHTIEADSEDSMDYVMDKLRENNFIVD